MGRIAPLTQLMVGLSVALFYCICVIQNVEAHQGLAFINNQRSSSLSIDEIRSTAAITKALHVPRGGRIIDDDEDEDDEYDYEDDEEDDEEEEINITKSLKASTKKASSKAKKQKATSTKKIVNESLSKKKKSATTVKKTKRKLFHIPYILKAMLNPFTVFAMTRGYFASLFNIDYLQEVGEEMNGYVVNRALNNDSLLIIFSMNSFLCCFYSNHKIFQI